MASAVPEGFGYIAAENDIIPILGTSDCTWCARTLYGGLSDGLTLKTCLHPFCTGCLSSLIQANSTVEQIMCPYRDENNNCNGYLTRKEIEHVLGPIEFHKRTETLELEAAVRLINAATALKEPRRQEFGRASGGLHVADAEPEIKRPRADSPGEIPGAVVQQVVEQVNCISLADFPTTCGFCTENLPIAGGIILQTCGCIFCKDCLIDAVVHSTEPRVRCPRIPDDSQGAAAAMRCDGFLLDREVKSLVSEGRYEEYIGRSLRQAKAAGVLGNLFTCKTPNCGGCCEAPAAAEAEAVGGTTKVFLCPLCFRLNCIHCSAQHDGVTCERYAQIRLEAARQTGATSGPEFDASLESKLQQESSASGWHQLASLISNGENLAAFKLLPSTKPFTCSICMELIAPRSGAGVVLQECLHTFCKECLIAHITHSDAVQIQCPDGACDWFLSPREIQALVTAPVLDQHLSRSLAQAEMVIPNSFHCCTPNCTGWCVLAEEDLRPGGAGGGQFHCPVCSKASCIKCKAIHAGLTCDYYQQSINDDLNKRIQAENERQSDAALQQEIQARQVVPCPRCQFLCQKISGCNHVVCGACKLSWNWTGV